MKMLFAVIAVCLSTMASAEWAPDMSITGPQSAFDPAWCSADGQTATVSFGFHLSSQSASAANLTYTQTGGALVSGPTYVADGNAPEGDWSFTGGKGALKTYDSSFTYTFPGTGTYTVTVCARQPGLDHDNVCSSATVVLACAAPTLEKCDREAEVAGKVGNGTALSCKSPINFVFKGPYGPTATVTVQSDALRMPDGNSFFTAPVARNGDSCVYNLQWKPADTKAAGGTVGTGTYHFLVGDQSYPATLTNDCK